MPIVSMAAVKSNAMIATASPWSFAVTQLASAQARAMATDLLGQNPHCGSGKMLFSSNHLSNESLTTVFRILLNTSKLAIGRYDPGNRGSLLFPLYSGWIRELLKRFDTPTELVFFVHLMIFAIDTALTKVSDEVKS